MHSLNRVSGDPYRWLEKIIDKKDDKTGRQTILKNAEAEIKARYAAFREHFTVARIGSFEPVELAEELEEALLHCYSSGTSPLKALRRALKSAQVIGRRNFCPYCHISSYSTIDHYLPQERFPELCVHPDNLVPACGVCNGHKSKSWLLTNGQRRFLNFYLDAIPAAPFLECDVTWVVTKGKRVPRTKWTLMAGTDALIQQHFKDLALLSRYKEHSIDVFSETCNALIMLKGSTIIGAKKPIENHIRAVSAARGPSNWRIVLIRKLVEDMQFLEDALAE